MGQSYAPISLSSDAKRDQFSSPIVGAISQSTKADRILHLLAAGLFAIGAVAIEFTQTRSLHGSFVQIGLAGAALLFGLSGFVALPAQWRVMSRNICISLLSFLFLLVVLEGVCRLVRYDFVGEERAWLRIPLYYRWPTVPTGEVYFRRNGGEQWKGRPLYERLRQQAISPNPYQNETPITLKYDQNGFRNEDGFTDWDVAVAGDSFTELGFLPYNELFTTGLGKLMNMRVLNLGTSYTGPLTQLSYLRSYGLAPSTKRAVICFYEGNDIPDVEVEYSALKTYQQTGVRPVRQFIKETSALRTLCQLAFKRSELKRISWHEDKPPASWITAYFKSASGEIPITLETPPPGRSELSSANLKQLDYFFEQFAEFGDQRGLEVWVAFMPCKERVVFDMIRFASDAPERQRDWRPTDLPQTISGFAGAHGVRFLDLTPALVGETKQQKELLYNSIWDTHLNSAGSAVVAKELARVLSTTQ